MVLSYDLIACARRGDLDAVQRFLAGGGDPDDRGGPEVHYSVSEGETLLHVVAKDSMADHESLAAREPGRCAIASALLAAGAAVDAVCSGHFSHVRNTPLLLAAVYGRTEMVEILCQAGADVNYRRSEASYVLALCIQYPDIVRTLLRFGADPSIRCYHLRGYQGPEAAKLNLLEEAALFKAARNFNGNEVEYLKSARLLKEARLLRPRLRGIFALRALCHRGRATPTSETPEGFALLFFAPTSRPRTRAAWRRAPPGLPDPLAHLVCKFWLGEPPRRHRAAAAPASE